MKADHRRAGIAAGRAGRGGRTPRTGRPCRSARRPRPPAPPRSVRLDLRRPGRTPRGAESGLPGALERDAVVDPRAQRRPSSSARSFSSASCCDRQERRRGPVGAAALGTKNGRPCGISGWSRLSARTAAARVRLDRLGAAPGGLRPRASCPSQSSARPRCSFTSAAPGMLVASSVSQPLRASRSASAPTRRRPPRRASPGSSSSSLPNAVGRPPGVAVLVEPRGALERRRLRPDPRRARRARAAVRPRAARADAGTALRPSRRARPRRRAAATAAGGDAARHRRPR